MTISIMTLILWSIICTVLGATVSAFIVWEYQERYYRKETQRMVDLCKESRQEADNWRHWTNVYRRLLDESEKRNTIIINEQPKGSNIPKFGD